VSINVGVIGCGGISRFHFAGLEAAGAEVSWVCDLSAQAAAPWAKKFGARCTADYREILADRAVQAVVVATFASSHKAICLAAIGAGKAVICEKTLAPNADDALEIVTAAQRRGSLFYTSYMKRFIPAVQKAKQLLPALGRILSTHIRAHQCWGDLWSSAPADGIFHVPPGEQSLVRAKYGGGILVCGGSHILDLTVFFLGRPRRLFASMHHPPGLDLDVQASVLMETDHGTVHLEALAHPLTRVGFLRDGWDERVEINGVNGRLDIYSSAWDQVDAKASLLVHYDNAAQTATEYRYAPVSPFNRAAAFFCDHIKAGRQGEQSALTGYDVDNLIAHIQQSAAEHRAVEVQWRI